MHSEVQPLSSPESSTLDRRRLERSLLSTPDDCPLTSDSHAVQSVPEDNLGLVMDIELNVLLRFGQRVLALHDILDLKCGSVVELDRKVDEPIELLLDGRVIARGEAMIVDGNYGLRVTEIAHTGSPNRSSMPARCE